MKLKTKAGTTGRIDRVFIQDSSSSAGAGLSGLAYNTASLTAYYTRVGAGSSTAISLVSATRGTWVSGGFVEYDATNMPGVYEIHWPNAMLAAGAPAVHAFLKGAASMKQTPVEIELDAVDYQSANGFISGVNSTAPPANWNLQSIDGNGRVDVIKVAGTTQTARDLGDALDAKMSTRLSAASYTAPDNAGISTASGAAVSVNARLPSSPSAVGSEMTLSAGERTTLYTGIWAFADRTLTGFGTLVSSILSAMFVDGGTNKLKVNADNSVNATVSLSEDNIDAIGDDVASKVPSAADIAAELGTPIVVNYLSPLVDRRRHKFYRGATYTRNLGNAPDCRVAKSVFPGLSLDSNVEFRIRVKCNPEIAAITVPGFISQDDEPTYWLIEADVISSATAAMTEGEGTTQFWHLNADGAGNNGIITEFKLTVDHGNAVS